MQSALGSRRDDVDALAGVWQEALVPNEAVISMTARARDACATDMIDGALVRRRALLVWLNPSINGANVIAK